MGVGETMVTWADKLRRVLCDVCKPLIDLNEVSVSEEEGWMSPGTEFQAGGALFPRGL